MQARLRIGYKHQISWKDIATSPGAPLTRILEKIKSEGLKDLLPEVSQEINELDIPPLPEVVEIKEPSRERQPTAPTNPKFEPPDPELDMRSWFHAIENELKKVRERPCLAYYQVSEELLVRPEVRIRSGREMA